MIEKIPNKNPAACYIELDPDLYKDNSWTGGLRINIITSRDNPMPEESVDSLIHLSQLVASTVALMEKDPTLANRLEEFIKEPEETKENFKEGKVIKLNFKTKTRGEA